MKRSLPLLLGLAAIGLAADQWTKHWATQRLRWQPPVELLGGIVHLTYTRNSGIAFGMFAGHGFPFYVFSVLAAVAVFVLFARHERLSVLRHVSLALILSGALGNLVDRVATGQVVDFILLSLGRFEFPFVFNVADTWVTVGVVLFAFAWSGDDAHAVHGAAIAAADAGAAAGGPAPAPSGAEAAGAAPSDTPEAWEGEPPHEQDAGADRSGDRRGPAGGPLAGEGADRPVA